MPDTILTRKSFSTKEAYSVKVPSGAVDTQLVRMPWASPVQKPGILRKVLIANPVGIAGRLDIWDSDLSNSTIPTAGSAGASLFPLEIGASGLSGAATKNTIYVADQLPEIKFNAGMTAQSTLPGVTVVFEVEYI